MTDVKRYDLRQEGDYSEREGVMHEVGNGDWVRAEDFDALFEEVTNLRNAVKDAADLMKEALSNLNAA